MEYSGPYRADLVDIEALNRAYLNELRKGAAGWERLPDSAGCRVRELTDREIGRVAGAPFLLLSVREHDGKFWEELLGEPGSGDLFATSGAVSISQRELLASALAYLWQLIRQNDYAARLVCGADSSWCEMLTSCPLVELLARSRHHSDILEPRLCDDSAFWPRLLNAGVSEARPVRQAALMTALQTMQMHAAPPAAPRLDAAACRIPAVGKRLVERS